MLCLLDGTSYRSIALRMYGHRSNLAVLANVVLSSLTLKTIPPLENSRFFYGSCCAKHTNSLRVCLGALISKRITPLY